MINPIHATVEHTVEHVFSIILKLVTGTCPERDLEIIW